jgi:DDE family transposase
MSEKLQQTVLPIKLERSEEKLTSLAGLVVLEELARQVGLWQQVDQRLKGPGSGRGYRASEFVRPLVWLLHAGGRRLEDVRELRGEQEVLAQWGMERLPDAGTFGDWLRRQGTGSGVEKLKKLNEEVMRSYLEQQPEEITLDVDASAIEANKEEAQVTYEGYKGYMPMLGYVDEACVHHEFRDGNQSPGAGALGFLEDCQKALPADKRVHLRSDSAYYQGEVIRQYSQPGRTFTITADQDVAVRASIAQISSSQWTRFLRADGIATDREIAETVHCMEHTESFRLIVVRWSNPQPSLFESKPYCYHAVASNRPLEQSASAVLWRHNGRGQSENWHKELKCGFGMEQMPCGDLAANAMYFAVGVLAYNLAVLLKANVLPPAYRHVTVATLRWQMYRLAGKLVRHGRRWILRIKTDSEKLAWLMEVRRHCRQFSP